MEYIHVFNDSLYDNIDETIRADIQPYLINCHHSLRLDYNLYVNNKLKCGGSIMIKPDEFDGLEKSLHILQDEVMLEMFEHGLQQNEVKITYGMECY
jgi:hypothetical protein